MTKFEIVYWEETIGGRICYKLFPFDSPDWAISPLGRNRDVLACMRRVINITFSIIL